MANLTRDDGSQFLRFVGRQPLAVAATPYPLGRANEALGDLPAGRLQGAAVLVP